MAKTKRAKLTKLSIAVGDNELELSPDETKELHDILNNLFGGETVFLPSTPIVVNQLEHYTYPHWDVTYNSKEWGNIRMKEVSYRIFNNRDRMAST